MTLPAAPVAPPAAPAGRPEAAAPTGRLALILDALPAGAAALLLLALIDPAATTLPAAARQRAAEALLEALPPSAAALIAACAAAPRPLPAVLRRLLGEALRRDLPADRPLAETVARALLERGLVGRDDLPAELLLPGDGAAPEAAAPGDELLLDAPRPRIPDYLPAAAARRALIGSNITAPLPTALPLELPPAALAALAARTPAPRTDDDEEDEERAEDEQRPEDERPSRGQRRRPGGGA